MPDNILPEESEMWKPVVGYEGFYEVSNRGRVRSARETRATKIGRILKPSPIFGYLYVVLARHGTARSTRVHRLVAHAFIGAKPDGLQINHKDGNKQNNCASNLEYVTAQRNTQHAIETGLRKSSAGEQNPTAKLKPSQVLEIRVLAAYSGMRQVDIGAIYGVSQSQVSSIFRRGTWAHVP
jgi:predicted XRE-type DNA-binding protein